MNEHEPTEQRPMLDAESAVLHAIAIVQHEERLVMTYHAVRSHRVRAAADSWSNRHGQLYRQLGREVDKATSKTAEASQRRRERILHNVGVTAATIGAAAVSVFGFVEYIYYTRIGHI